MRSFTEEAAGWKALDLADHADAVAGNVVNSDEVCRSIGVTVRRCDMRVLPARCTP